MDSLELMYGNLTSLIRKNVDSETVSLEYSNILKAYPGSDNRLLSKLDAAFRNLVGYKIQRSIFELGSTHHMAEIGSPSTGDIYPYSESRELQYSQKGEMKP